MIVNNAKAISEWEMSDELKKMFESDTQIIKHSQQNSEKYEQLSKKMADL